MELSRLSSVTATYPFPSAQLSVPCARSRFTSPAARGTSRALAGHLLGGGILSRREPIETPVEKPIEKRLRCGPVSLANHLVGPGEAWPWGEIAREIAREILREIIREIVREIAREISRGLARPGREGRLHERLYGRL